MNFPDNTLIFYNFINIFNEKMKMMIGASDE